MIAIFNKVDSRAMRIRLPQHDTGLRVGSSCLHTGGIMAGGFGKRKETPYAKTKHGHNAALNRDSGI
jgi:hypothetical protein